jgi:hypothetical protein
MFARVMGCQAKHGKGSQISTKVTNDVLPILQKQSGFVDFIALNERPTPKGCAYQLLDFPRRC